MRLAVLLVASAFLLSGCLKGSGGLFGDDQPGPRDFVSSKTYSKWVIEVDTIQGMAPPASAMDLLKSRLQSVANKPGGIEIRYDDTLPARGGTWSLHDLTDYSDAHLDAETKGNTAVLHLMFLDGTYEKGTALGVTISSVSGSKVVASGPIAVFSESIRDSCSILSTRPCTDDTPIWGPVLVHEFGHAMGLVNNGIPMVKPHEATTCNNEADSGHSSNSNSVMNCAVETSNVVAAFTGGIPTDYDSDDRADLCNAGGKC